MDFLFEFLDIHMNEKTITYDFHDFKWQNINIYPILTLFFCSPTPFMVARWIVITSILFTIAYNYPSIYVLSCKSLLLMWI
jgi:hypothetical protein